MTSSNCTAHSRLLRGCNFPRTIGHTHSSTCSPPSRSTSTDVRSLSLAPLVASHLHTPLKNTSGCLPTLSSRLLKSASFLPASRFVSLSAISPTLSSSVSSCPPASSAFIFASQASVIAPDEHSGLGHGWHLNFLVSHRKHVSGRTSVARCPCLDAIATFIPFQSTRSRNLWNFARHSSAMPAIPLGMTTRIACCPSVSAVALSPAGTCSLFSPCRCSISATCPFPACHSRLPAVQNAAIPSSRACQSAVSMPQPPTPPGVSLHISSFHLVVPLSFEDVVAALPPICRTR